VGAKFFSDFRVKGVRIVSKGKYALSRNYAFRHLRYERHHLSLCSAALLGGCTWFRTRQFFLKLFILGAAQTLQSPALFLEFLEIT